MITFSKFGKHGRLGNHLFQLAAMIGFSKKYNQEINIPYWVYSKYFKSEFKTSNLTGEQVTEASHHYTPEYYDRFDWNKNIDLFGYFQSERYFENCITEVLEAFQFKDDFKTSVEKKYYNFFKGGKKTIAISIRRGDFVNNPNYAQIPITYYYSALEKYFPNWQNDFNVIIFSDDINYCKFHFGNFKNVFYAENKFNNVDKKRYFEENVYAIEQLCLMSICDHFIISNSTFSWWGAYLGETSESVVITPTEIFDGNLKKNNNTKDYYPNRWLKHEAIKIDLRDVTFMIPVHYDHNDRKQNLSLNVCLLQKYFDTNIIIGEQGSQFFGNYENYGCEYVLYNYKNFHRTKMLNKMAETARTSIIVNWDADVFISPLQILYSIERIRLGNADVVYPYDGRFARVPRVPYFKELERALDVGIFSPHQFKGMLDGDKPSVGGAVIFNRQKYFEGGGENENFIAYGPEDVEREVRFTRLGYKVERTQGALFHLDHYKGANSKCAGNPFDKQNHDELEKIYSFSKSELRNYVNTFKWLTK